MRILMNKFALLVGSMFLSGGLDASGDAHWGYAGHQGPEHWAELSHTYSDCAGKSQSPINLNGFVEADLPPIGFHYQAGGTQILNNGHTVQINYEGDSHINVDGRSFKLLQFHFHVPSENQIDGKSFPMEGHFVHVDTDGNLAVVAVMYTVGEHNLGLSKAWFEMPKQEGEKQALTVEADAREFLPKNWDYYRFNGSLTTPPCTEGVRWFVLKEPVPASESQIEAFSRVMGHANNRPVQAINGRVLLK